MRKIGDFFYNTNELEHLNYNQNLKPLNKVLENALKEMGIYDKIVLAKVQKLWSQLVGTHAAEYTAELQIIHNRLYVKITSAALRQELNIRRSTLLRTINKLLNANLEEIVVY